MTPRAQLFSALLGFVVALLAAMGLHLLIGATWISPSELASGLRGEGMMGSILWDLRLPRVCTAALVGLALGAVGSSFQALFRNPIADPYVVGVSGGAAVGGALALVLGFSVGLGTIAFSTAGGLGALLLVLALATRRGRLETPVLLLSGVVVGSLLSSVLSLVLLMGGQDSNIVLRWLLGSLTPAYWDRVQVLAVVSLVGVGLLLTQARALNALSFGEEAAQRLGTHVPRAKWITLLAGATMVATTVGAVGIIGFLGLVAPHIARRLVGVDWRWSLPASALAGATLLTLADIGAQRILQGGELPVGVVTAILGAPTLLGLMRTRES